MLQVPHDFVMNLVYQIGKLSCFPEEPFTHERITRMALQRVLLDLLRDNMNVESDFDRLDAIPTEQLGGDDDTLADLLRLHQNQTNVQLLEQVKQAYEQIAEANRDMDKDDDDDSLVYSQNPEYHFDAERFFEANAQIVRHVELAVRAIRDDKYDEARKCCGRALHTVQDFYSHSSWLEMQPTPAQPHGRIGFPNAPDLFKVAPANMSTCVKECAGGRCDNYLDQEALSKGYLTSGYFEHTAHGPHNSDHRSLNVPKPPAQSALKCSHGAEYDVSRTRDPIGGINKDFNAATCSFFAFKTIDLSPHYTWHKKAALMAVEESYVFLRRLRNQVDNETRFAQFLGVSSVEPVTSVGLVVDTTGSMQKVIFMGTYF